MKTWKVTMKVDGILTTELIKAESMRAAQDLFRKMYVGHQTILISTVAV